MVSTREESNFRAAPIRAARHVGLVIRQANQTVLASAVNRSHIAASLTVS